MRMILYTLLPSRHHGSSDEVTSLNKCMLFKFFFTKYIYTIEKLLDLDTTGVIKLVFLKRILCGKHIRRQVEVLTKKLWVFKCHFRERVVIIFIFPTT